MNILKICAAALIASLGLGASNVQAAPCNTDKTLTANKALVVNALDAFFNKRNVSAVDEYIGAKYLQHNPAVPDSAEDLKAFIGMLVEGSKFEFGTQAAEDDLVWTHGRYTGIPGRNVQVIVDVFRVKDGKLVEHWDIAQDEAVPTSAEELNANKKLAADALDAFFNQRNTSAVDMYISAEYLQHNPTAADGSDALKRLVSNLPPGLKFELGAQVAEDDLVWTQRRGVVNNSSTIFIDIFRVKDSKFVEHWDIQQKEVQTTSRRPMFPITP